MDNAKLINMLTQHLMGACDSVFITCDDSIGRIFPIPLEDVTAQCDSQLDLRYLIRSKHENAQSINSHLNRIIGSSWQIRSTSFDPSTASCIIIDEKVIYAFVFMPLDEPDRLYYVYEQVKVNKICGIFNNLWKAAEDIDSFYMFHEDFVLSSIPKIGHSIATISKAYWDKAIRLLSANPKLLYNLPPRKFEELIAELPSDRGLEVILTPHRKDGSYDILAYNMTELGKHLFLVECKKYAPNRPVGVEFVRALFGIVEKKKATGGMIVTSSSAVSIK